MITFNLSTSVSNSNKSMLIKKTLAMFNSWFWVTLSPALREKNATKAFWTKKKMVVKVGVFFWEPNLFSTTPLLKLKDVWQRDLSECYINLTDWLSIFSAIKLKWISITSIMLLTAKKAKKQNKKQQWQHIFKMSQEVKGPLNVFWYRKYISFAWRK